jgi:hypothetical protein
MMSLFAGEHSAWEYDAIVADVVREIVPDHLPEVNAYYDHYSRNFSFLKKIKQQYFQQIFPFQPRCFEVVRNITKRELATTRSSIHHVYKVLERPQNISRQGLIKVADLLDSPNLVNDLQTAVYHEVFQSYQSMLAALADLFDEAEDLDTARDVLKTLFLWHCAFKETPRGMTASDLAEACLKDHEVFKKEDYLEFILGRLRDNQLIDYPAKDRGAFFRVSVSEGPNPAQILARIQRTQVKDPEAKQEWQKLLTTSIQQAGGIKMLFQGVEVDRPQRVIARDRKIRYEGERVIVKGWSAVWGNSVVDKTDYDLHFRLVYLLDQVDVDASTLHDDRIAVVIPGPWEDTARDISRRYLALVKMQEEYQDKQGPEAEEVKRFIGDELRKVRGEIALTQKQLYHAGRIVTQAGLGIDPTQVFTDPDKADEHMATALLRHAYTAMPIDADAFKKEFTDAEAGKLFNALFGGSTQSGDLSAVDNFAIGLALISKREPKEFDPVNCTFFAMIRDECARAGGELRLYSFYEKYTGPAFGLLQEMVTLYLLAFVRLAQPHCYLTVKSEAGLKLKTGKAPLDNRIGPTDVVQVTWTRGRLHRAFDRLVQADGPSWNDLVEFARIIDESLKATTERAETETQQDRFFRSQQQWHDKLEGLRPRWQRLTQTLRGNAAPFLTLVDRIDRICQTTGLEEFERTLKEDFERDPEKFREAFAQVKTLDELDRRYTQPLIEAVTYLEAIEAIPNDDPLDEERTLLTARFVLETFCRQPTQAAAVLDAFEGFKRSYSQRYQVHYREYRRQRVALHERLGNLRRKADGLQRMNEIAELGGAVGAELPVRYKDLLAWCDPKDLPETLPDVQQKPIFQGITLLTEAPEQDVTDFEKRLEDALHTRLWQLADETISAILRTHSESPLRALLEAIQAADALKLAEHFTPEVAELVRQMLQQARLVTVDVPLAEYDGPAQLGDDPKELEDVMGAFRTFLTRRLDEARRANPGKTVRLNLKSG